MSKQHVNDIRGTSRAVSWQYGDAIRQRLGFKNRYDFALWTCFGGILALFCLKRILYIHPPTLVRGIAPGEQYWMEQQPYKFGMFLHLATIIPAALLCITQFVPRIRTKAMIVHRRIGYTVISLVAVSIIGTLIIVRHTFGGDLATQAGVVILAFMVDTAMFLAWWNIKKLQIDQHRKWIIRAMVWMSQIITLRVVMIISGIIVSSIGGYTSMWTCEEMMYVVQNATASYAEFPQCHLLGPATVIGVPMAFDSKLHAGSTFRGVFATSLWVAMAAHVAAVEIYLALTSAESERLRIVSYHKQRAAGMAHPGSAGTTSNRWGDGKLWQPPIKVAE